MSDLLKKYFPDGAPRIIEVAFKYGYGEAIMNLNKRVYFNPDLSFSPIVLEAIQALCLSSCDNEYCSVMHARGLVVLGFSLEEVRHLIEHQRLPKWAKEESSWEPLLRKIATIFREPALATQLYRSMEQDLSPAQIADVGSVVAFSLLHKFLLEFYPDEVAIDEEPILFRTTDLAPQLINYFRSRKGKSLPLYAICCACKDLRTQDGWLPVERALSQLPSDATFSHGLCDSCTARFRNEPPA